MSTDDTATPTTPPACERLCWFCRHFDFNGGSPHYSEVTPGSPMSMSCGKRQWYAGSVCDGAELAVLIQSARECRYFELDPSVVEKIERERAKL